MSEPSSSVRGTPLTDEELAALAVVLAKRRQSGTLHAGDDRPLAGGWNSYYRIMRPPLVPGREAWRRR